MTKKGFMWMFVLMWIVFLSNTFALFAVLPEKPSEDFAVVYFVTFASEIILFCWLIFLFSGSFNNLLYKNWTVVEHFIIKDHNLRPIYREYNRQEGKVIIWTVDSDGKVKRGIVKDEQTDKFLKMEGSIPAIENLPHITTLSGEKYLRHENLPNTHHAVNCVDVKEEELQEVHEISDAGDIKT
ncbi:MAG: hypothetical protein COV29_01090 [Candidatus Yanofskybacteria bacterium CG10_big_fil_rev_8_21_14_0_10_36_16]|uniref:Uncharacterized protein n=1 Tax=Candidatus Yanofskybacteria bacterium CG10_big_fil_rev_8_21_14_0_10_36_16 TaxID=1975096 RepID=A0A2J0Q849_9BACT|nr:MAG: hypothetical protein COV29_01090 [Candidatus Yanofskybacteria bacterium CG10_big_fil_rev_8_21_14_0_10_36_16]